MYTCMRTHTNACTYTRPLSLHTTIKHIQTMHQGFLGSCACLPWCVNPIWLLSPHYWVFSSIFPINNSAIHRQDFP